ncbi:ATP-binding cassette domain-containing protein [Chitinispirillales bacterium ANBcel5]|uniref:ABC transporter ATP-binding protein n=1 Tax=Cellulosispirillum alkaliphilum TaxID=3039283 RepID=UPI002A551A7E|nr:ATP-binding cassette domain-containing protein [Chitinispirillales bacterium ANBcel5]
MSDNQIQKPSISVNNLKIHFPVRKGVFSTISSYVKAVDDVTFSIFPGEVFALVGESGCGKTTTAQSIMGLVEKTSGSLQMRIGPWKNSPTDWSALSTKERKKLRQSIQIIFQDPYSSLSPRMNVRAILEEPLIIHGLYSKKQRTERILEMLSQVGLSKSYLERYPHEFSGGQRQRIGIARALATSPEFIIADEPVSALDVSIQAQIINLLQDLQSKYKQTLLFISHDLAVVRHVADRIGVMYLGKILEMGTERQIFTSPLHPYTHLLLRSVTPLKKISPESAVNCADDPRGYSSTTGCSFYPRCSRRSSRCRTSHPSLENQGEEHMVACYNPDTISINSPL